MNLSIVQLLLTLYGSVRAADGLHLSEEDRTKYIHNIVKLIALIIYKSEIWREMISYFL